MIGISRNFPIGDQFGIRKSFKSEGQPIFAFKGRNARVFCFFLPDRPRPTLVLTHGYTKQSNKLRPAEWQTAYRMYQEVIESLKQKEGDQ